MKNGTGPVCLKDVFLDESYGRQPRPAKVKRFVQEWNQDKAGVILVSKREEGGYACLDGNTRTTACRKKNGPKSSLPALIYYGLSVKEEAELWVAYNKDRTQPIPAEVFVARLAAGDRRAKAIEATLSNLGLAIASAPGKTHIRCVRAVERLHEFDGGITLERVMGIFKEAWSGEGARDIYREAAVHGLGLFLLRYDVSDKEVIRILQREGPLGMRGEMYRMRQLTAGDVGVSWGRAFKEKYNWKRKSGRLHEWPEYVYTPGGKQSRREKLAAAGR